MPARLIAATTSGHTARWYSSYCSSTPGLSLVWIPTFMAFEHMLRRQVTTTITGVTAHDIRFPTSRTLAGSDAMNKDPDYSAAYVVFKTDHPDGLAGHGLTFTTGRGTELCVQ